jgi:hypothetical protein
MDVTIDREMDEDGNLPKGRTIVLDEDHLLEVPAEFQGKNLKQTEGDDHGRALAWSSCSSCWWNAYYGWVTYCCTYYTSSTYCDYYYC